MDVMGRLKMQDWKMRDRNAGVENKGPSRYGKPNVALCNVYSPMPRIRSCISVWIPALPICVYYFIFVIFVTIRKLCNIKQICVQSIKGLHQQTVLSNIAQCVNRR